MNLAPESKTDVMLRWYRFEARFSSGNHPLGLDVGWHLVEIEAHGVDIESNTLMFYDLNERGEKVYGRLFKTSNWRGDVVAIDFLDLDVRPAKVLGPVITGSKPVKPAKS